MLNEYKTENLRDALKIIKLIDSHDHFSVNGLIKSTTFESKVMNNVLNLLLESNLITIREDDKIIPTENAVNILRINKRFDQLLGILESYLVFTNPPYMHEIYNGIETAKINMPSNIVKIFRDLGLFSKKRRAVLFWWNKMKSHKRSFENVALSRKGLEGEFLIIDYENKRTGSEPTHISIDDDRAGYDIKSIISKKNSKKLLIEVKNSSSNTLRFFVTKNEYFKCINNKDNYIFYLIDSRDSRKRTLYKFGFNEVYKHIPDNQGLGKWTDIEIKPDKKFLNECNSNKI